jgi:serine/threonine protein kinase
VAVKIYRRPVTAGQSRLVERQRIARLRHPFLLTTHLCTVHAGRLFVVQELAEGSLRDRLAECNQAGQVGIPAPELRLRVREAAAALDYLHGQGVQHCGVKPTNILLLEGHGRLADSWAAGVADLGMGGRTATGSGTPSYMPPEAWAGRLHRHGDQYSLAVTFAELRRGQPTFPGRSLLEVVTRHLQGPGELAPLGPAEQAVLRKAMARDPDERYESCLAFVAALEGVGNG